MAHHFRWSEKVDEILNPQSVKITVLRDPVKNFESVWGFFRDYPFLQWLGEDRILNKFLEAPAKYYDTSTPWYFRAQNYMAFDLGLDFEDNSPAYIRKAIDIMESRFGLVLLTDFFEESLILLKGTGSLTSTLTCTLTGISSRGNVRRTKLMKLSNIRLTRARY